MKTRRNASICAAMLLTTGCAWPSPERQLMLDFFQACRVYDTSVMARMASVSCNPREFGVVERLDVLNVQHDQTPLGAAREEVSMRATIRPFEGTPREESVVATIEQVDGRWMITALTPPRASRTSPAASSALPK